MVEQKINHSPLSVAGRKRIGLLAVHGFTGSPHSMRPLADFFTERGYAVEMPLLPGHGSRWENMLAVSRHDWLTEVDAAYWRLRQAGHEVVPVGLSMGGTLALRQAVRRPVAGTVVVNPFLVDPVRAMALLPFLPKTSLSAAGIASDIALPGVDEGGYNRTPLNATRELHLLGKETRPSLSTLRAPVLYFRSRQDHVVTDASHRFFQKVVSCPVDFVSLEKSYHVATLDYDAPLLLERSLKFIEELETGKEG